MILVLLGEAECLIRKEQWDAAEFVLEQFPQQARNSPPFFIRMHNCSPALADMPLSSSTGVD